jgi:hypothetical protein
VLELSEDTRRRLAELEALSKKAEDGDVEARRELRLAVRRSSPEVVAAASDYTKTYRLMLSDTFAAGDPLRKEAFQVRVELLRSEVAGENATPLENLLADRIAALWLLVELLEALVSAHFYRENERRVSVTYLLQMVKVQESVNRRYLAAIRELARVRKLQAGTPAVQYNTQINLR